MIRSRALVTGAIGFVGSHVVQQLLRQDWEVIGIDSLDDTIRSALDRNEFLHSLVDRRWTFHQASVGEFALDRQRLDVDAVIHLAGSVGLAPSWRQPDEYLRNNAGETRALARVVKLSPRVKRVVHASTSSVYGETAVGREDQPLNPASPYGTSKLAAEQAWTDDRHLARRTSVLRLFSVYGPRQRPDMVWSRFIESAINDGTIRVNGDGTQTRSFTYAGDVATAIVKAADPSTPPGIFNIAGTEQISLTNGATILERILGRPLTVLHDSRVSGDQLHTRGDTTRASLYLGYEPRVTFEEGLHAQVQHHFARALL